MNLGEQLLQARHASRVLAKTPTSLKNDALEAMAKALVDNKSVILQSNSKDIEAGKDLSASLIDRLRLTSERIDAIAEGLRSLIALTDPVGEVIREISRPNGLHMIQKRVPFGVVAMIYEARPNVTVDAAGICLKTGNAVLLRGSSSAFHSNVALVNVMRTGLETAGLPVDAIQLVSTQRETVSELLHARGQVDLVIPRGGAGLIDRVVRESVVPVIETGVGNCHVYVHESADLDKAIDIIVNAKVQRPSVCNAAETLLVDRSLQPEFLPKVMEALTVAGVTIHGDHDVEDVGRAVSIPVLAATEQDWLAEYGSLDLAVRVVANIDEAIEHIRTYGSQHTEAIVAQDVIAIERFVANLDSAAIMINASTRFTDGEEFGFGAEIGISTQKLHARGPMGLPEMTSTTWIVTGSGQIR